MKKFRVVYWIGSISTDRYLSAVTWGEALKEIESIVGERMNERIIRIECISAME